MSRFCLPRDIYHGKGCLEELKNLKGKRMSGRAEKLKREKSYACRRRRLYEASGIP